MAELSFEELIQHALPLLHRRAAQAGLSLNLTVPILPWRVELIPLPSDRF